MLTGEMLNKLEPILSKERFAKITMKVTFDLKGKNEQKYVYNSYKKALDKKDIPDAVLIRALEPIMGVEHMLLRTHKKKFDNTLTSGPGNAAKALGISKERSGLSLFGNSVFIAADEFSARYQLQRELIGSSKRIGVESAGDAALLPYRFYLKENQFVSGAPRR